MGKDKKCKKKSKYELITIALPTPPGVRPLPPNLFFLVDNRFNDTQKERIRLTILRLISFWQQYYEETATNGTSQWAACTEEYATKKLSPVWASKKLKKKIDTSGEIALEVAMYVLTHRFRENGSCEVKAKIKNKVPKKCRRSTIFGKTADDKINESLSVIINPFALDTVSDLNLTGSLTHAWLHRCGYDHPKNKYTTYFIGEAPMCLMRSFQPKVPGQPDSLLTQYFD